MFVTSLIILLNLLLILPWVMIVLAPLCILVIPFLALGYIYLDPLLVKEKIKEFEVLIVDDNPSTLVVLEGILKARHCILKVVKNGFEAIEALKKTAFDLVFIDYAMPDVNGSETLQLADDALNDNFVVYLKKLPVIEYASDSHYNWSDLDLDHFRMMESLNKKMPPSQLRRRLDSLFAHI